MTTDFFSAGHRKRTRKVKQDHCSVVSRTPQSPRSTPCAVLRLGPDFFNHLTNLGMCKVFPHSTASTGSCKAQENIVLWSFMSAESTDGHRTRSKAVSTQERARGWAVSLRNCWSEPGGGRCLFLFIGLREPTLTAEGERGHRD